MTLTIGTKFDRYKILSPLGAGGMGEVYLAEDTRLDRKIAIKLLPSEFTQDEDRVQRFIQEAKAASALNHPNIITIYEIGEAQAEAGGTHYIATEFIEGQTLRHQMASTRMKPGAALDVATQVASALGAAHTAGIIHRDIKPENVMVRPDGLVKVLDFGLAKLTERRTTTTDTEAPTAFNVKTDPGTVMGTAQYMSPEQARGIEVDARTDIFSLGVVLYEMIAGRAPFAGTTATDIILAIVDKEPPPLSSQAVPAELQRIVSKALRKDREERYQTAKDLLLDLKSLKQEMEIEARLAIQPKMSDEAAAASTVQVLAQTAEAQAANTEEAAARTTSSAEYLISGIGQHKMAFGTVALVLLALISTGLYLLAGRSAEQAIDSVAVLPFVNASADPNTEYLSDGIAESLINSLSQIPKLRVIPRSTAFRYKGSNLEPHKIGRELGVRAVLTGKVTQRGDTLSIQTDLIDVERVAQMWGEVYDRKLSDLLAVKQEISREIAEKLRLRLSGEQQQQLAKREAGNSEAYQSYLKGRYYWNRRTAANLKKAIDQFQQAVDKDPNYALAYTGLADCYAMLEEYARTPASETLPKAKAYAQRALQLDETLAEAHASLALINEHSWQFGEAEKEYKRAISLNPNYPTAHHWYSNHLRNLGRLDETMAEIKRAQELDPLSPTIGENVVTIYTLKGGLDAAIEQAKRVIELDPNHPGVRRALGRAYLGQRRYPEAIAEYQKAVDLSGRSSTNLCGLGYGYAIAGKRAEALAIVKELEERYDKREALGLDIATVYAGLGDKDQVFVWLEKDFQAHSGQLVYIGGSSTYFDSLRSDPRYGDLLRRVGLKP